MERKINIDMKCKLLIVVMSILVFSCSESKEDRVHALVKNYLDTTLSDNKSYEPMTWGEIKPWHLHGMNHPRVSKELDICKVYLDSASANVSNESLYNYYNDKFDSVHNIIDSFDKNDIVDTTQSGWEISHQFRANNKMGGKDIFEVTFYLNMEMDKIIKKKSVE